MNEADIEIWRRNIRQDTLFRYHYAMADALERNGDLSAAIAALERGLSIAPMRAEAVVRLRDMLERVGQTERAAALHADAEAGFPHYEVTGWTRVGDLARQDGALEGRLDLAISSYRSALARQSGFMEARYGLLCALLDKGENSVSQEELLTLTDQPILDEERKIYWAGEFQEIAEKNLGIGHTDLAASLFRLSRNLDPSSGRPDMQLGLIALGRLDISEAYEAFMAAIRHDSGLADAFLYLGFCHLAVDRVDDAIAVLRQACSLDANGVTMGALGLAFHRAGWIGEATTCYSKALELWPNSASSHVYMALGQMAQGQMERADASLETAIGIKADSFAFMQRAVLSSRLGKTADSQNALRRSLEQPEWVRLQVAIHPFAREELTDAYRELGIDVPSSIDLK
ncbi:tetratricopeptide repeat protein [Azospirillum lipoferum]|uniref:Uncharacterized protein n=1 Tax=Azospirillum lipoferum (strain 4B) TaxID=862719 RepID=G7ZJ32_AZOL4|nr:tetratricopeptide repeat protein [Azospirillum lipoferum]CBS91567.1 protein of unknown function [Azospirillum lipoferum 4B]